MNTVPDLRKGKVQGMAQQFAQLINAELDNMELHVVKLEKKKHIPGGVTVPQQALHSGSGGDVDVIVMDDEPIPSMPITSWQLPLSIQNNREAFFHVNHWRKEPFTAR